MILTIAVNALWQGALVIGITLLALRSIPVENAKTRYAVWFTALMALAAVPVLTSTLHVALWHAPQRPAFGHSAFSLTTLGPYAGNALRWLSLPAAAGGEEVARTLLAAWCAGALFGCARLALSWLRIATILRTSCEIARIEGVPVLASPDIAIPIATGILNPAIVLPSSLMQSFDARARACTIEHELAHVRRGDVAGNATARIVAALFFWNPWVHYAVRRLAIEREAACDDWAVYRLGRPSEYATSLAALARTFANVPAPLVTPNALGSRHSLVTRIERLLTNRPRVESRLNYIAIGGIIVLFAAMTVVLQTLLPAPAHAGVLAGAPPAATVAAACAEPNAEPQAVNPVAPDLPKAEWPSHQVSAVVAVTVAASGKAFSARVYRSSGDANVDRAVLTAAEKSTYSPKRVNCTAVQSTYLFKANFGP